MGDKFKTILNKIKYFLLFIGLFIKEYFSMSVFIIRNNIQLNKPNTFDFVSFKLYEAEKRKSAFLTSSLNFLPGIIAIARMGSNGSIEILVNYLEDKKVKKNYVTDISDKFQTSINNIFN